MSSASGRNLVSTKSTVYGLIIFSVAIVVFYGIYHCVKRLRRIRDFQQLEVAHSHADSVLADLGNDSSHGGSQISMVENKRVEQKLVIERLEDEML